MTDIKNHVWAMVEKFKSSHFNLSVASHMQYDDDVTFNENNVTMYLTELEEYISVFITYLAHREKNPDAPMNAIMKAIQLDWGRMPPYRKRYFYK